MKHIKRKKEKRNGKERKAKRKEKCLKKRVRRPPAPMHRPPCISLLYIYIYII